MDELVPIGAETVPKWVEWLGVQRQTSRTTRWNIGGTVAALGFHEKDQASDGHARRSTSHPESPGEVREDFAVPAFYAFDDHNIEQIRALAEKPPSKRGNPVTLPAAKDFYTVGEVLSCLTYRLIRSDECLPMKRV